MIKLLFNIILLIGIKYYIEYILNQQRLSMDSLHIYSQVWL